jgi:hypothetical protein
MVTCSFGAVTVPTYEIESISAKGALTFACSLKCRTPTYSIVTSLQALQGHIGIRTLASGKTRIQTAGGTKATLVLNGTTYLNCYIEDMTPTETQHSNLGQWEFTIKFQQETI